MLKKKMEARVIKEEKRTQRTEQQPVKKIQAGHMLLKWLPTIILALIWLAGAALRLYKLTDIPSGIHVDEAGMAYDAWCLGNYGTDRFLNKWPVYLINYGSGQSAMYAYLAMIFMKIGGVNLWMIRMPAFLSGCAVMIFGTLTAARCFATGRRAENSAGIWAVILTALMLAVCPYFIMASRMGFDCNLMLGFSTVTLYLIVRAAESGKKGWFIGAGVWIGLTLYTYSLSWMVMPFFLVFLMGYLWRQKKITWKNLFAMGVPAFVLAVPLLLFVVINKLQLETMKVLWFTVPKIPYFRTDHFNLANMAENALILKTLLTTDQYTFNAVEPYGTLFGISVPFVLAGIAVGLVRIVWSISKKKFDGGSIVFLWFFAQMLCALITKEPDIYRTNGIYFSLVFLAALSMRTVLDFFAAGDRMGTENSSGATGKRYRIAVHLGGLALMGCYLVCGVSFAGYYFGQYSEDYPVQWYINDYADEIMQILKDADPEQEIYFDNYNCTLYASDCLIRGVSPYDWNQENDMFTQKENFGNRHYYLPPAEEIKDDAWYIVMDYSGYGANLEARGFERNTYGYYKVYYKK